MKLKYEIGQEVYYIEIYKHVKISKCTICSLAKTYCEVEHDDCCGILDYEELFPTREAAIEYLKEGIEGL